MKAEVATAKLAFEATGKGLAGGMADAEKVYLWSRRRMEAERDASAKPADRVAASRRTGTG